MMERAKISNLYTLEETIAAPLFNGKTYPWEVLPVIKTGILDIIESLDKNDYEDRGDNVFIHKKIR